MSAIAVTPIYAALLALLLAGLGVMGAMGRGTHNVALGHGDVAPLNLTLRRFGNLTEWVPMALLVLLLMELTGVPSFWLHVYGATLLALRLLHPFVLFDDMGAPLWQKTGRFIAAAGTAMLIIVGAITLIV